MESSYESHVGIMNKIYPIGLSYNNRNTDDNLHWHENLEILYFLSGECDVVNGSEEIKAQKDDIIIINSEAIHGVRFHHNFCEFIVVHLDHTFCESMGFNTSDFRFLKKINDQKIANLITNALEEQRKKQNFYQESVKITLLSVLLELFRNYIVKEAKDYKTSNKVKLVKKIIKFIYKHFDEQVSIEEIENYCRYSRFYISRAFKEITGTTIMIYLNNIRIEKAKSLLENSNLSISEISANCGFVSQSYFGKVFRKSENMSPLEYKTAHK
ncbi:MAG: AraC family transcriptional regulator [Ruminococcaceae bacterium]|nr:AraC family transcriptional regulator [Oscillospiraceae bacterium]